MSDQVGLPSDDDMGNSEVGHNALGSGQVVGALEEWCCILRDGGLIEHL